MTAQMPPNAPHPARPICPFLSADASDRTVAAIDYPSFENRCWAGERPVPLLLTDQATLCLCTGFRHCPRYIVSRAARHPALAPAAIPLENAGPPLGNYDPIAHAINELETEVKASSAARTRSRRRWGWFGAGLIFVSSLLCGGVFAGYVGWQLVNRELLVTQPGTVDTLAEGQAPVQPQIYLIVTATSEPAMPDAPLAPAGQAQPFPVAVTPTAVVVGVGQTPEAQGNLLPLPPAGVAQAASPPAAAPPNVQLEIPTRRPTPVLDIPTSTPSAVEAVTSAATPTPTPIWAPPFILFSAQDSALKEGDCTRVAWTVENVREVYYENQGVDGRGEREECMDDHQEDYVLTVVLSDGSTRSYTTTVAYIPATPTPEPKPTATEFIEPTPTWTPSLPTATPTPVTNYGVRLELNGSSDLDCARAATCEVELLMSNTGDAMDNLTLYFTEAASWPRQLCRLDGVCSQDRLTIANIGPGNSAILRLRVTVPDNAPDESMTYRVRALSESSPATQSDQISIQVHPK